MRLTIEMLKKVCVLNNKILSARMNNEGRNVWFKVGKRNAVLAIGAYRTGNCEAEGFVLQLLITYFESLGELCYSKSEIDENDDLIIHLKRID